MMEDWMDGYISALEALAELPADLPGHAYRRAIDGLMADMRARREVWDGRD